ncbi:hypothetical protein T4B_12367 [Trichinella pseudospiralis]|uniref:Uncharacterized protein n=2 Tax=Trichinella pseudospiralis TaxID=6337 RepID=A0A0V1JR95_TRIPS|nr:hypothetical protein T4E_2373 [Trichinella pseudospiralis]KRY71879.1 hypothetical protein T4A_4145 [Trichinella pseudospiralis]KRY81610.1 hypothetical protein T4D_12185 [Trichinella pseudospiralis]KRZ13897.1 hypothetical protein T4B_12367 [Trichinella pseudospiralis]KRZ37077.1 hypothetical protein T4C_3304 [Trichinella pseudospiralis]
MLIVEEALQVNVILLASQQCGQDAAVGLENDNACNGGRAGGGAEGRKMIKCDQQQPVKRECMGVAKVDTVLKS